MKKNIAYLAFITLVLFLATLLASTAHGQSRQEVVEIIREASIRHSLNPELTIAIATVESGLNPDAIGSKGEIGVFQLRPEYHAVRPGNVKQNVEVALIYLSEIRCKWEPVYGDAWFIKFNLGPNYRQIKYPTKFAYYQKVMAAKSSRSVASH